jgi:hypothetical protein
LGTAHDIDFKGYYEIASKSSKTLDFIKIMDHFRTVEDSDGGQCPPYK